MKMFGLALTLAGSLLVARAALAGDGCPAPCGPACGAACGCGSENCCSVCGKHCACMQKVCKLECGTETVIKHVWRVVCEEFCPLLPGCKECEKCCCEGEKCPSGGCCESCCKSCKGCAECKEPEMVTPKCGHSRVKKTLIRVDYPCQIPCYQCKPVYLCPECAAHCQACGGQIPAVEPAAPTPAPAPAAAPGPAVLPPAAPPAPAAAANQSAMVTAPLPSL